ncbi:MAG: ATP-binding cassette domain-containing protein [Sporomusaceae bacterium]|nr:ATP-binding cassette domain-containing protein [Sporomusaceae bacterium]
MNYIVEATDLKKHYGSFRALDGVSFFIRPGECFGLLGHNGAGKTTTMRMLCGLSTVEAGELRLFGEPIRLTPPHLKARLGVVPQEDNLDPELTVIENLRLAGGYCGLDRRLAEARGRELLQLMGLEEKESAAVDSLSGGLKRRLVIARALINQPRLVILDEPTTGLDPQARRLVWQKLRGLKADGVTLILTTHYMEEAAQLCDRLLVLDRGKRLAEGSPAELVAAHVAAEVIEVHLPLDRIPADFAANVTAAGGQVMNRAEGLFLYSDQAAQLWRRLEQWGVPVQSCVLRPATLEDVFLKLTGKERDA